MNDSKLHSLHPYRRNALAPVPRSLQTIRSGYTRHSRGTSRPMRYVRAVAGLLERDYGTAVACSARARSTRRADLTSRLSKGVGHSQRCQVDNSREENVRPLCAVAENSRRCRRDRLLQWSLDGLLTHPLVGEWVEDDLLRRQSPIRLPSTRFGDSRPALSRCPGIRDCFYYKVSLRHDVKLFTRAKE
ncbi:hypothetical protein EVAR_87781_1 [Eumeta japonica]|uniref:Uncharacterized protein n=1 Tax=Eumeta variegata TaxID=151549 RepID=A0A4C1X4Y0_EUMVA|nr:hypothetical protein EVAR_87781_1 [Eumeta japonica]